MIISFYIYFTFLISFFTSAETYMYGKQVTDGIRLIPNREINTMLYAGNDMMGHKLWHTLLQTNIKRISLQRNLNLFERPERMLKD